MPDRKPLAGSLPPRATKPTGDAAERTRRHPVLTELDAQLGETRGPNGKPSASDFLLIDLPTIADAFAERFDEFPTLYRHRDDYRYLVTTGRLVDAVVMVGQLVADGSIRLFGIDIDLI